MYESETRMEKNAQRELLDLKNIFHVPHYFPYSFPILRYFSHPMLYSIIPIPRHLSCLTYFPYFYFSYSIVPIHIQCF